jgi:hypothetical protein
MRRLGSLFVLVVLFLLPASAASADPAGPTNYASTINTAPEVDGVTFRIFGGDAFLVIEVEPGAQHEVLVYGYEHSDTVVDPYLRIQPDGTVEVNRRSPARWANLDRYQAVEIPDTVDASAPPDWEIVATDGRYAWHDHRIHWMSPALPSSIDPAGGVQVVPALADWQVPVTIDGTNSVITGTLRWQPSPSLLPWIALGLLVAALAWGIARRKASDLPFAVIGAGVAALLVGLAGATGLPPGVGLVVPTVLLPVVAIGAAVVARRRARGNLLLSAASGLPLLGWSVVQFGALTAPIVPSSVSALLIRAVVSIALGTGIGAIVAALSDLFSGDLSELAELAAE